MKLSYPFIFSLIVVSVLTTALVIYLTPLRHLTFISPVMNEMDPKQFYELMKAHPDEYVLIDVRSANIYQSAHAEGAISIPIENLFDDHFSLAKENKHIGLICTTGRLAGVAYGYLENWGFRNLIHIQGGMVNWTSEGLPVNGTNISTAGSGVDEHQ